MYAIRGSTATEQGDEFVERPRTGTNLEWLDGCLADLPSAPDDRTLVLLLGGRSPYDFRLRVAQSHLRDDMSPSHWSHAALVEDVADPIGGSTLCEVSLEPRYGFGMPAATNAVQRNTLDWYDDPAVVPNIALLSIPVSPARWKEQTDTSNQVAQTSLLEQLTRQRVIVDLPGLVLPWLGYVWGVGAAGNPVLDGIGVPSAVMIEALVTAAGYDLSPGLDSQAATPEAFWQTACWWHRYFQLQDREPIRGFYCVGDRLDHAPPRQQATAGGQ